MAGPLLREQVLPLLAAANNHGDLDVKLSSLRQAKDVLLSADSSQAAEIFPYFIDLQSSPETMLRKYLIQVFEEISMKSMEHALMLMPVLLASLRDDSSSVVKQSIVSGTNIFYGVLEELSMQFHRRGLVERWLEEFWTWMIKFKDAVFGILFEAGPVGVRLLAIKFLEIYALLFTPDATDSERYTLEASTKTRRAFNISWIIGHHPIMDPAALISDANRTIGILLDLLHSASSVPGSLTISVVNSLATIAKKRPAHYNYILSALLDFDPNFEMTKGGHTASIQYSLRTAFLGFLRCTHPAILESRERLQKALRAMNAGDAADQVLRQLDKMMRNQERASREARVNKDDQPSNHLPVSGDATKKRANPSDNEDSSINYDSTAKRGRYVSNNHVVPPVERNDSGKDYVNGVPQKVPVAVNAPNLVEQMISMIAALISEGERGVESLEILIAKIPPDVMADIVITNMRHLPRNLPSFTPLTQQSDFPSTPSNGVVPIGSSVSKQTAPLNSQLPVSVSNAVNSSISEMSTSLLPDSKRDPRRDPRRLDPRRVTVGIGVPSAPSVEDHINPMQPVVVQSEVDASNHFNKPLMVPVLPTSEIIPVSQNPKIDADNTLESSESALADWSAPKEEIQVEEADRSIPDTEENATLDITFSSAGKLEQDSMTQMPSNLFTIDEVYSPSSVETDQRSPPISNTTASEDTCDYLPSVPPYIELTEEQQRSVETLAIEQIMDSYKRLKGADNIQTGMAMLSRLIAQINADADADVAVMVQKHILSDYQQQKGHEVIMHVLYHLRTLMLSDSNESSSSSAASLYDKILMGVAKFLLDTLPATDKSFSRLLSEVPYLPDSVMRLLVDLCSENYLGKDGRDGDRVTQGLGAVWGLILGRPPNRQACLDIALKCAVHSKEDVRAKAIRLVTNKLYVLSQTSENIEQFAMTTFLSAVDHHVSGPEDSISGATNQRKEAEVGSQETSVSGSQSSDAGISENDFLKGSPFDSQSDSALSFAQAQRLVSLFFALCTKKPSLLQLVFDNYGRAHKAVKQAIHRHMPILIRAIGSSSPELLHIISDPPQGCENLLSQVISILSEGTTPPPDLIAVVKHLYETKLKDASILIPMLSSFSKSEVLPIFPRLVSLPLDKFQIAMARILQGSAHTGPALSPAEVLVAIHDINPERDGLPLKKITDVCSACFEQRTVFTQQVLAKALNQIVDQIPLPLLFMRTVIQAIDAFPTLVDFVMEILSKLVNRQVWKMPKLWVGFLKCVSQTQPHSFSVLLQLPPPQLESALNKYAGLRGPLTAFANQPNVKNSLPRPTLALLGLLESNLQQPHLSSSLHPSEASPSVRGATLT